MRKWLRKNSAKAFHPKSANAGLGRGTADGNAGTPKNGILEIPWLRRIWARTFHARHARPDQVV